MTQYTLGIGGYSHDASAALYRDGHLLGAVQEERLTRNKHQGGFPFQSIKYLLDLESIDMSHIDQMCYYSSRFHEIYYVYELLKFTAGNLPRVFGDLGVFWESLKFRVNRCTQLYNDSTKFFYQTKFDRSRFYYYSHHLCHAASGFYFSEFDDAAILCIDWGGEGITTSAWTGEDKRIHKIFELKHPNSLGIFYNRLTQFLGFSSYGDEYKVMGLAASGKPVHAQKIRKLIINQNDEIELNLKYFDGFHGYLLSPAFVEEFGPMRKKGAELSQDYADMAASVQEVYENCLFLLAEKCKRMTGKDRLVLVGGSALNCKANGALAEKGVFKDIFVSPTASDVGTSCGAAMYHLHHVQGVPRVGSLKSDAQGPEYQDEDILEELDRSKVPYEKLEDPAKTAAEHLAQGKIIGWVQGRMEFGPRSLGYRSILADPRDASMKDRINSSIKFREEFRPFAPACLKEKASAYFYGAIDSPFMTYTCKVHEEAASKIPAIVHLDQTARLQTVDVENHPDFHELISRFEEISGVPILLNTSFNLADEPIVCSPKDALRTFFTCGIDSLFMGSFLVRKSSAD